MEEELRNLWESRSFSCWIGSSAFFFCHFDLNEFFYWIEVDSSQEFLFLKNQFIGFCFVLFYFAVELCEFLMVY